MTFEVSVAIPISYTTGVHGSTVTYTIENPSGAVASTGTLTENGSITGVYEGTFTPTTAGVWKVVYTVGTTILTQSFPVAFGTLSDASYGLSAINTKAVTITSNQNVAATDGSANALARDAVGAKDDAAVTTVGTTKSIVAYVKGILTNLNLIKAKTDNLPAVPASQGDTATALSNQDLDHLIKVTYGGAKPTVGSLIDLIMNNDGTQTFSQATHSLQAIGAAVAALGGGSVAVDSGDQTWNITTSNDTVETQVFETTSVKVRAFSVYFSLDSLNTAGEGGTVTIRVYSKVDGSAYDDKPTALSQYVVSSGTMYPSLEFNMVKNDIKVTIQCSSDVTVTRSVAYRYITRVLN